MKHIKSNQTGLSLVELMIAITLGLIVSGAVATIFLQSKASYSQNDEIGYLQDNGRFALNTIAHDLELAGFFGGMAAPGTIVFETDSTVDDYLMAGIECGPATKVINGTASWTYDARSAINYRSGPVTDTVVAAQFPCIAGYQSDSDFLTIKRVRGNKITDKNDLAENTVYLYTNRSEGAFNTKDVELQSYQTAWEYIANLYYIKDNTLKKMYLGWDDINGNFNMFETDMAEGIEKFHILWGIDSQGEGAEGTAADYYTSSPSNTELRNAVTARVYVLARSSKEVNGYSNEKSYQLGDISINFTLNSDGYYRRVFSTAVALRNPIMLNTFEGN